MRTSRALNFVILLGIVSLFADMTYEGARSAVGPFLGMLGASAFAISVVSGGGELVGYGLRLWSGRLADRTHHYWAITFAGYALNLFAVPLLAFAGNWQVAAALVILERTGKALRTPARDAMLSYATKTTGRGWGFGLHEALDQVGATVGPLVLDGRDRAERRLPPRICRVAGSGTGRAGHAGARLASLPPPARPRDSGRAALHIGRIPEGVLGLLVWERPGGCRVR